MAVTGPGVNFMRILGFARLAALTSLLAALTLGLAACDPSVRACKAGTVFVPITLQGAALAATTLDVSISVGGAAPQSRSFTLTGKPEVSFVIEFGGSGYPAGQTIRVELQARSASGVLAMASRSETLSPGCTALPFTLGEAADLAPRDGSPGDGPSDASLDQSVGDGGASDLQPVVDLRPILDFSNLPDGILPPGGACTDKSQCATGHCIDGVCCEDACEGQCESCNAAGVCLATLGAPVGTRTACAGTGECADACDGNNRTACASSEGKSCGTTVCSAGQLSRASVCTSGTCPSLLTTCTFDCGTSTSCIAVQRTAHGYYHSCAVLSDGTVRCWGQNDAGQLGTAPLTPPAGSLTPVALAGITGATSIAATFSSTCAGFGPSGRVSCWGSNSSGQLGFAADSNVHAMPSDIPGITAAEFVVGGTGGMFCAVMTADRSVQCWGGGIKGDGDAASVSPTPVPVAAPGCSGKPCAAMTGVQQLALGDSHACAILSDNSVACWGDGSRGANGSNTTQLLPQTITGLQATHVSAGNQTTCVVESGSGQVKCFGAAERLGHGIGVISDSPTPIDVCLDGNCTTLLLNQIATAQFDETVCALGAGGAVSCWGSNSSGQLGDGSGTSPRPYASPASIGGAVSLAAGGGFFCAVVAEGPELLLRCWGDNGAGQLGDNTMNQRGTPVPTVGNP